ncbi:hypothetical protein F4777DRAFT_548609 [Nemania sp. FL0916]|nr:hypothetical protein F4777DRAFT_548609 [Nemania sp. FL0916]
MEQVAANHGEGISQILAPCADDLLKRPPRLEPPKSFKDFHNFPNINNGFRIKEDFSLPVSKRPGSDLSVFIQAWLFFGLIFTVVQTDGKPILQFRDLVRRHNDASGNLSTRNLHTAIEKWTEWESSHQDGVRFRMIQAGWVLDFARQVIQKNFAYDLKNDGTRSYLVDNSTPPINPKTILVLMCLGETLSAAKARIVEKCRVNTNGWHGDNNVGWGPPKYVLEQMEKDGWCPRAMAILRGQVNSNATMLVAAYHAYRSPHRINTEHSKMSCTPEECKVKFTDEKGNYTNRHHKLCPDHASCKPCGPCQKEVIEILQKGQIPLLEFSGDNQDLSFKVDGFDPMKDTGKKEFVTISHVWSDGWGNEEENKLNYCQLSFIRRQIRRATGAVIPFWMDTLVVPVQKGHEKERKKAIRQIFQVFGSSACTIILDNGLADMDRGGGEKPAEAAMKVFSSVWMRRLWTLQEAYLSKKIWIPFEEVDEAVNNLVLFDTLEEELKDSTRRATSGITQIIRSQLSYMIMGEERRQRSNDMIPGTYSEGNSPTIVANAYRAARWRATGVAEHEVLALATLLKLQTEETKIEEAGLAAPGMVRRKSNTDSLESLVCAFWYELNRQRKGIIPSGMIFLPGEKVNRRGYGWAPKTWFSTYEMDYPDPLNSWHAVAELEDTGLRVSYPGFLLHPSLPDCRGRILGISMGSKPFAFPVDRSLNEWYSFQRIDDPENGQPNELTRLEKDKSQLAIILSGLLPREDPKEVALLVEVTKLPDATPERKTAIYQASIIHRVLIWRESNHPKGDEGRLQCKTGYTSSQLDDHICLGEALGPSQQWVVDRPANPKVEDAQENVQENVQEVVQKTPPSTQWAITKAVKKIGMARLWGG